MTQQRRRPTGGQVGDRTGQRPPHRSAPAEDRAAAAAGLGGLGAQRTRVRVVVEPVVVSAGYDLETLSIKRVGRRHLVRVIVDGDDGVNLDAVARLSRDISAALDAAEESGGDLIAGEYELEVSSPGVDRPLSLPRHWRRNAGRLVKVTVADRSIVGRVRAADEHGVELDVDGQSHRLGYEELGPGRVQIEFNRLTELADGETGVELDEIDDEEGDDEE
jgi:ribosome maturation factor RimP